MIILDVVSLVDATYNMKILASPQQMTSAINKLLKDCREVSFAVAWASCGFDACEQLLRARRKIGHGIVGTHFYQTDPEFIERFKGNKRVKFVTNPSGVFHPKVYIFEGPQQRWNCLIGSANFTQGAFVKNTEVLLHIEPSDDPNNEIVSQLREVIGEYWTRQNAKYADEIDLNRYCYWRERFKRPLERLGGGPGKKSTMKSPDEIDILNLGWSEFFSRVSADRHHALALRISVLSSARALFDEHKSLAKMPPQDRKGIAGYVDTADTPWGWFGSMKGAGEFKKLIKNNSLRLSEALDQIPLTGPVRNTDYRAFIDGYLTAFPKKHGKPTRHGLATATRLLAMKRPDYFVCFDSANRLGLSKAFGTTINHHDYMAYWDSIVEPVCDSRWWNSAKPKREPASQVWDGRAAFLDAIYYVPA